MIKLNQTIKLKIFIIFFYLPKKIFKLPLNNKLLKSKI